MKKLTLLLMAWVISASLHAQELTVKSFSESGSDLSARTYSRMDNNDVPCALVKVRLASAGAVFEGSVMGSVEYKTSEYWVYMPKGSKRLTVKLEGYLPLPVEFEPLESSTTYVLTITGVVNNGGQTQEVRTRTGWIILDSEPQGASVYINNEYVGDTPLDNYKQAYGTYSYRLEMPNYHSQNGTLELNASRYEKTFKLAPAFGSIAISGISGATVLLDGKQTGKTTPCTLTEVASGQHTITLQKAKYAPRQLTAQVQDGQTTSLTANLDARFASLTIISLKGAQIYVDGKQMGTSKYTEELMEGYHDIEARLAHYKTATLQVQIRAGQPQIINLDPTPIYGSLDVISTPRNAIITIDGKQYGQTPNTIDQLLEGEHSITLSLTGYSTVTKSVTISDGQTATLSEMLQNGRPITITCKDAGAHIYVDGQDMGVSPYNGSLTFGRHTTYALLNGKKTGEQTISVPEGNSTLPSITLSFFGIQTFTVNGVTFKMVAVKGGSFTMGATSEQGRYTDDDEKPAHKVTLSNYYIGETEVTQALWKAVMGSNPSDFKGDNLPVETVNWNECQTFIQKLNSLTGKKFRLPTEAEWEYAARGGSKSKGYKYSGSNTIGDVAWYSSNSSDKTHPVKTKQPNELGIYDMSGNVWEWCQDWYSSSYYSSAPSNNPTGPTSGSERVLRGGGWSNGAGDCRSSFRDIYSLEFSSNFRGLRLVLVP